MSERLSRTDFVVQKYRLAEQTVIDCAENGVKLGSGKLMDDATLARFIEGDPSGNLKYLDWMLFQAGGGQEAMERSLSLWQGDSGADPNSLRNQCRLDFIEEQVYGYTDERGVRHAPITREEAIDAWEQTEERSKFEFLMGDQDVAVEDGYGFYRNWPGKNGLYQKIVNSVRLWHSAQAKLLAQNQRYERWQRLAGTNSSAWSADDKVFMARCTDGQIAERLALDIYAGWKPKEYSQAGAVYKNLDDLLRALANVRRMQVAKDVRFDKIYEDNLVSAVCPLTIAASMKFGIGKWCVCNKTEFERYFATKGASDGNWQRYNRQGPLVFMNWKIPMPPYLHKIALHIPAGNLRQLTPARCTWVDCQNLQLPTNYEQVRLSIQDEHERVGGQDDVAMSSDDIYSKWGGRRSGLAWCAKDVGQAALDSLSKVLEAVRVWGTTFDPGRVVLDFVQDVGTLVDKSDE